MSEHVEHVIADGPPPEPPPAADQVTVIEAEAEAAADVIEAAADAEVRLIEARAEAEQGNEEWRSVIGSLTRSQEDARHELETFRTDVTAALTILSERVDQLTPPPPPPEPEPPNPDPGQSEATNDGGEANPPETPEPAKEPEKPERKRAHRWI